ncbi:MAG: glutamyl-tRNA reductase [Deltaproteobacteria bacterium]|nr:glutamyl-tRNA reductase [Deltaproteobacteria bacterium]
MVNVNRIPFVIGCSFHSAPMDVLGELAIGKDDLQSVVKEISGWIHTPDLVVLSTCNRTEIVGTTKDVDATKQQIATYFNTVSENAMIQPEYMYCHSEQAAVTHLFRVIGGLDSMMIGETEIVGQLQYAFGVSQCEGLATRFFVQLFDAAFRASRRVRGETGIDKGITSVAKAGVHMARRIMGDLSRRRVLIVGAGETGVLTGTYLSEENATIYVTNRSHEKAVRLAADAGGTVVPFDALENAIAGVDMVFLATGAKLPLVTRDLASRVQKRRKGEMLLIVDISMPPNAAPDIVDVGNVFLFNMSDLKDMVARSLSQRAKERKRAELIVAEEVALFYNRQRTMEVGPLIAQLRASFEDISARELAKYENRLSEAEKEVFRQFAGSLVNKLLHHPTVGVRELAEEAGAPADKVQWFEKLFGLDKAPDVRNRRK